MMAITINGDGEINGLTNIEYDNLTVNTAATLPANTDIGSVTDTELGYVDGVTSAIQTQINAGGLVLVASETITASGSTSIDNCFTSDYENYRVIIRAVGSTTLGGRIRLRASGVDATSAGSYARSEIYLANSTTVQTANTTDAQGNVGSITTNMSIITFDVSGPFVANPTPISGLSSAAAYLHFFSIVHTTSSSYDGITFFTSTGTVSGSMYVYGYRN